MAAMRRYGRRDRLCLGVYACCLTVLVYLGCWRSRGDFGWNFDAGFLYAAGQCWLDGISPYDHAALESAWKETVTTEPWDPRRAFVYPPPSALICLPMALLEWEPATRLFRAASLLAFLLSCVLLARLLREGGRDATAWESPWGYLGLCALLYPVCQVLRQGQITLIVLLGIVACFYGWRRGNRYWIVVGAVLACIKPHLSLPLLLYVGLRGGGIPVLIGAGIAFGAGGLALLPTLSSTFMTEYRESMAIHRTVPENLAAYYDTLPSFLGHSPVAELALKAGVLATLVWAAVLAIEEPRLSPAIGASRAFRHLQIICVASACLMPLHRWDMPILVPVVATLQVFSRWWERAILYGLVLVHGRVWTIASRFLAPGREFWEQYSLGSRLAAATIGIVLVLTLAFQAYDRHHRVPGDEGSLESGAGKPS